MLLNFGINKIVTIEIAKNKNISKIIKQSIYISIFLSSVVFVLGIILSYFSKNFFYFSTITFGLCATVLYLTFDGILQGLKRFKSLSISNFIFYTISLNLPSISLIYQNNSFEKLIVFSIIIKIFALLICVNTLQIYVKEKIFSNYNFFNKVKKIFKMVFSF